MNNQGGRPRQGPGGATGVLHVIGGNDRGKQYLMVNPTTQIGRGADQDFVLADIAVSRRHVQILIEGPRYRLRDLGSGNGTLINGVRTATALLNDGDQVEIGNTLLRFDHPPSSARATGMAPAPQPAAAMPQAAPQARTMIAEAPQLPQQQMPQPAYAPPPPQAPPMYEPPQQQQQQQAYAQQEPMRGAPPMQQRAPAGGGGLLDTTAKKIAVFGSIGLVILVGGGVGAMKLMGGGKKEQAAKFYADATESFKARDFENAKKLFNQALLLDPQNTMLPKQLKSCDVELHAKSAIKQAQALAGDKRWDEEFKLLDSIDKSSMSYDDAEKLRKAAIPQAATQWVGEAKELMASDAEGAKTKLESVLLIDPENVEAKELAEKLKGGGSEPVAANTAGGKPKVRSSDSTPKPRPTSTPSTKPSKPAKGGDDDEDAGGFDLLSSKGGGPYKAKDFNGAATQVRNQAKSMKGPAQQKALNAANQVQKLGELYVKAESDKTKNAVSAVTEYQQAAAIDSSIGKGTHSAYFKAQAGKLAKDAARQAFTMQKFDTAFEMAKIAQRLGDDGGVGAQLKAKANEFNGKAAAMAKSNPNGAKNFWRNVVRMVPPGDPAYVTAQKALATSTAPAKGGDEDED